jgi:hypothetical protein
MQEYHGWAASRGMSLGMRAEDMHTSSIDSLAQLLAGLRRSFGAEVIDVRDDMDGSIVVDVRVDAGKVMITSRRLVREQVDRTLTTSRELVDRTRLLQHRHQELVHDMLVISRSNRVHLKASRARLREVRTLQL